MIRKPSAISRFLMAVLLGIGIGYIAYNLLDDEHKRVIRYVGNRVKYLPDRYML